MNPSHEEIRRRVVDNAQRAGMHDAPVHVAPDSFGGFQVRVVHAALEGVPEERRRSMLLHGVEEAVSVAELLTPVEEEWYGEVFATPAGRIPTWPEALGSAEATADLVFLSDLDRDPDPPVVVTFYSMRGGVGRTTALAATAHLLAARGKRVLAIDMDFEAPGLPVLFGLPDPADDQGALAALLALEREEEVDVRHHMQRVTESEELYCIPCGRIGADYAERLRLLDPEIWYREVSNPLHQLLDLVTASSVRPDVILLDSRTGISPVSAPLLFDVPDLAVICFFPHPQARRGTELLVNALLNATSRRSSADRVLSPEPRFLVSPVPPGPSAELVRARASEWVEEWLAGAQARRPSELGALSADELVHHVGYSTETAFRDTVAAQGASFDAYGPVAEWLEQLLPAAVPLTPDAQARKKSVLAELDFSTGTAESQDNLLEDYVQTRVSAQAVMPDYPLVIGRKGTGKTALFRWLLEKHPGSEPPVPVFCPAAFKNRFGWVIGADGFAAVEAVLPSEANWRTFWACYTALATYLSSPEERRVAPPERLGLDPAPFAGRYGEVDVLDALRGMLGRPDAGPLAVRWLEEMHAGQPGRRFLLFDGLDTGFGGDSEGRRRRTRAVSGLMVFLTETEARLPNFPFKVMLRLDIWQHLTFENKSHLYGRSTQLMWRDQGDYFKTVLKQAMRAPSFRRMATARGVPSEVDTWDDADVFRVWNLLVGERMKGGKTTFTRNWVWNRLADGKGDHGPRALSQLFNEAALWERREEGRSPYDRSIIRPRALVPSLDTVSVEALQALSEEFVELDPLVSALRGLGRTPFDPADIGTLDEQATGHLELALEVGLVSVHEGTEDDVRRYRVPELYRRGLGMTRPGQA